MKREIKITGEVATMLAEGWCYDCNGQFQRCARSGKCFGHELLKAEDLRKEERFNGENPV